MGIMACDSDVISSSMAATARDITTMSSRLTQLGRRALALACLLRICRADVTVVLVVRGAPATLADGPRVRPPAVRPSYTLGLLCVVAIR
jgi:hypothetical protein